MEFFCLCMSPALDASVSLPAWPSDGVIFKDVAETENVGGKGINVARWLALRGAKVSCGGLLGADNAAPFEQELARCGIGDAFLRVPGATRRNEMIVTPGGSFKLNRPAFPKLPSDFDALKVIKVIKDFNDINDSNALTHLNDPTRPNALTHLNDSNDLTHSNDSNDLNDPNDLNCLNSAPRVAILSGSLPPAVPKDFYAAATRALKARGWTVALDASGEALRLGVAAGPDLIKPNADECEPLVGFVPKTPDDLRRATEALRAHAAHVIISDGGVGAWFDGEFVAAPQVDVLDTTSAGDTLLAEYCWRMWGFEAAGKSPVMQGEGALPTGSDCERGRSCVDRAPSPCLDAAMWAVAAGSAAVTMPGSMPPSIELVKQLKENIK